MIHHGDWSVQMTNGRPEFVPPSYIDPNAAHLSRRWRDRDQWRFGVFDLLMVRPLNDFCADVDAFDDAWIAAQPSFR
jgi:hypothetical protein